MIDLERLFNPRGLAIVGASSNPDKSGYAFSEGLLDAGYENDVYFVNKGGGELLGRKVYRSLDEIGGPIDVVLNVVPRQLTPAVVDDATRLDVPFGIIYTANYAEVNAEGRELQDALVAQARAGGMRLVGPNTVGILNTATCLNLTQVPDIAPGPIGFVSQSGNVAETVFHTARGLDIGFSKFIGVGNQGDLSVADYLAFLADDEQTEVIALYLESLRPGDVADFVRAARRATRRKPVVVLKGGVGEAGSRAASSHTAGLSSSSAGYAALFESVGFIQAQHLEEIVPLAESLYRCPPMRNSKVALVGSGGGHATLVTDEAESCGLQPDPFSPAVQGRMAELLPAHAQVSNPVDMAGAFDSDLSYFAQLTGMAFDDEQGYGGAIDFGLYGTWRGPNHQDRFGRTYASAAHLLGDVQQQADRPIVFFAHSAGNGDKSYSLMRKSGIPCYDSLHLAARCMQALREWAVIRERPARPEPEATICEAHQSLSARGGLLADDESLELLADHGIPVARHTVVDEINDAATEFVGSGRLVLKALVPGLAHKSDVGGLVRGIDDLAELRAAAETLRANLADHEVDTTQLRFMVMEEVAADVELIVGAMRDPVLGPLGVVGLGGIYAEAFQDVVTVTQYDSAVDIARAVRQLRSYQVLAGDRGKQAVDVSALAAIVKAVLDIMVSHPQMQEIDINPLLAQGNSLTAVDALVTVAEEVR